MRTIFQALGMLLLTFVVGMLIMAVAGREALNTTKPLSFAGLMLIGAGFAGGMLGGLLYDNNDAASRNNSVGPESSEGPVKGIIYTESELEEFRKQKG